MKGQFSDHRHQVDAGGGNSGDLEVQGDLGIEKGDVAGLKQAAVDVALIGTTINE